MLSYLLALILQSMPVPAFVPELRLMQPVVTLVPGSGPLASRAVTLRIDAPGNYRLEFLAPGAGLEAGLHRAGAPPVLCVVVEAESTSLRAELRPEEAPVLVLTSREPTWIWIGLARDADPSPLPTEAQDCASEVALARSDSKTSARIANLLSAHWNKAAESGHHAIALLWALEGTRWAHEALPANRVETAAYYLRATISALALDWSGTEIFAAHQGIAVADAGAHEDVNHAQLLVRGSRAHYARGRFDAAVAWGRRGLEMRARLEGHRYATWHRDAAVVALAEKGAAIEDPTPERLRSAESFLAQVCGETTAREGPESPQVLTLRLHFSEVLVSQGRNDEALQELQDLLALQERAQGLENAAGQMLLMHLLRAQTGAIMDREVIETATRLREIGLRLSGPRSEAVGIATYTLGRTHGQQGRLALAEPLLIEGAAILSELYGATHKYTLSARSSLGNVRVLKGDLEAGARELSEVLADLQTLTTSTRDAFSGAALSGLAFAAYRRQDFREAREFLQRVLDICERLPSHQEGEKLVALSNLAHLSAVEGDLLSAYAALDRTIRHAFGFLDGSSRFRNESSRLQIVGSIRGAMDLMVRLGARSEIAVPIPELYSLVLRWKGQVARGLLAERAQRRMGAPASRDAARPILDEIRTGLGPTDRLLDFVLVGPSTSRFAAGADLTSPRLFVFVVRADSPPLLLDLGDAAPVRAALDAHVFATSRRTRPARVDPAQWSQDLIELLWKPLALHVAGAERIFVCSDGFLAGLPFETLPGNEAGSFLIEQHQFVYVQSAEDLTAAPATAEGRACLVGDLEFGTPSVGASRSWLPLPESRAEIDGIAAHARPGSPAPQILRGAHATVDALRAAAPQCRYLHFATHGVQDGTRAEQARRALRSLATNALSEWNNDRSTDPVFLALSDAGLVLALANAQGEGEALLSADEVAALDLGHCELAVLSACETAASATDIAEELLGLRRAFRLAGARATIGALWRVPDTASRTLMVDFYRRFWTEGRPAPEALRAAQLALLDHHRRTHRDPLPATWGAFIFEGISR